MHKVERNNPPKDLKKKNKEFQKKLENKEDISNEWSNFRKTKLGKQTEDSLYDMYLGCCAYCEGIVGAESSVQIDHFKPQSKFPELTFVYDNLHLACEVCNKSKSTKYNENYIDPSVDDPSEHIKYYKWEAVGLDEIGTCMIEAVDLNKEKKLEIRKNNYLKYNERLVSIDDKIGEVTKLSNKFKEYLLETLNDLYEMMEYGNAYCTMYKDNFKTELDEIKEILSK